MIYQTAEEQIPEKSDFPAGRLIAFCSGSKAVGKTWLASTLAHCLALQRRKVLFFDADCSLENVSDQLDADCAVSYFSLLHGLKTMNNAVRLFARGNFDLICSPAGENALISAPIGRVQILGDDLRHLARSYDFVFVDCSDEDSASVNVFLNLCRDIILLSNPDPFSLSEAYRKIIRLKKIAPEARLRIVINHAQSFEEGQALYKLLLKASEEYIKLDLNLLGIIRQDAHIREAVLNKELLLKRYPACNGTQDAALIAQQLLKDLG